MARPTETECTVPYRPDLVLGLVIPVGTPTEPLLQSLDAGLRAYGYVPELIRMSDILRDFAERHNAQVPSEPEQDRIAALQNVGDRYCEKADDAAAVALGAVVEIGARRRMYEDSEETVEPRAWILSSLKRDAEVIQLRQIYGDHVIIIGAQADRHTRKQFLSAKIKPKTPSEPDEAIEALVDKLLARDLDGDGESFGQNILETFPMSDCFIRCDGETSAEVERLLKLLFGDPDASVPTNDEYGMYLATTAAARSPELGRKVGAAVLVEDSVAALGYNSHPMTPTQAPQFDSSKSDLSRLVLDTLEQLSSAGVLSRDAVNQLGENSDAFVRGLLGGVLKKSEMAALTEFQVPVHAEMAALLDALKQGKPVADGTIYVTSYPCHGCARHILRMRLAVVYLDPYPKSRAAAMYGQDVHDFRPFSGVAPSRYLQWFSEGQRRSSADGSRIVWGNAQRLAAEPRVTHLESDAILAREWLASLRARSPEEGPATAEPQGGLSDLKGSLSGRRPRKVQVLRRRWLRWM